MPTKVPDGDPERVFWTEVMVGEALSVAAFARHALELESLGAPRPLVARARVAAEDELRHFGIARAELRRWGDPPRFDSGPLLPSLDRRADFEAMVVELVEMGCVNESLSAHEACQLAARAEHPRMRQLWTSIAADETEHAALAWEVLDWALAVRPELAQLARETFARLTPPTTTTVTDELATRGAVSAAEREAWAALAWHQVVEPMRRRLLG